MHKSFIKLFCFLIISFIFLPAFYSCAAVRLDNCHAGNATPSAQSKDCTTCKIPSIKGSSNRLTKTFRGINIVDNSKELDTGIPQSVDFKDIKIEGVTHYTIPSANIKTVNGGAFTTIGQSKSKPQHWGIGGYFRGKGSMQLDGKDYQIDRYDSVYLLSVIEFKKYNNFKNIYMDLGSGYTAINWKQRVKDPRHKNNKNKKNYGDDIGAYFEKHPEELWDVEGDNDHNLLQSLLHWDGNNSKERGIQDITISYVDQENVLLQQISGSSNAYCKKTGTDTYECDNAVYEACKSGTATRTPYKVKPGTTGSDIKICKRKDTTVNRADGSNCENGLICDPIAHICINSYEVGCKDNTNCSAGYICADNYGKIVTGNNAGTCQIGNISNYGASADKNAISDILCNLYNFITGKTGRIVIGFVFLGAGSTFLLGKMQLSTAIAISIGCGCIFGASTLVSVFTGKGFAC